MNMVEKTIDIVHFKQQRRSQKMNKKDLIEDCQSIMSNKSRLCTIELNIHMPTGETETIQNPNIKDKIEYISKAYDDKLHLKSNPEIYIISYSLIDPTVQKKDLSFGTALDYAMGGHKIRRSDWDDEMYVRYINDVEFRNDMFYSLPSSFTLYYHNDVLVDWFPTMADIDSDTWEIME